MNSADDRDAILAGVSAQFIVCFAQFIEDCDLFDKSESNDEALVCAQETYPSEHSAVHRQWRHALKQLVLLHSGFDRLSISRIERGQVGVGHLDGDAPGHIGLA